MKKSQLQQLIRECVREVIKEEEEAKPEIPKAVEDTDSEIAKLSKLIKKLPDELKSKLLKKIKAAQGEVSSYIDDLESKETKKD